MEPVTTTVRTPDVGTSLAVERTRLAYERTLMAWVRTATALISFGFTIYKFFDFEVRKSPDAAPLVGPRVFALIMITIGLVSLAMATYGHQRTMAAMRAEFGIHSRSTAAVVAGLVSILGLFALVVTLSRS